MIQFVTKARMTAQILSGHLFHIVLLSLLLLSSSLVAASCHPELQSCIEADSFEFSLAMGGGAIINPLNGGDNIPLIILPSISYYGEQFYLENTEIGYTLTETRDYSFSLTAGLNGEKALFSRWHPTNLFAPSGLGNTGSLSSAPPIELPVQSAPPEADAPPQLIGPDELDPSLDLPSIEEPGTITEPEPALPTIGIDDVSKREWAADGGMRLNLFTDWGRWQFKANTDITGVHHGYQLDLLYQQGFIYERWLHVLSLGGSYKSENLVDYYYGVDENDDVDPRLYYQGKGSINPFIRWYGANNLNKDWQFIYWLGLQQQGDGISDSPLMQQSQIINGFVGFSYRVM